MRPRPILLSWSSGKDSAFALLELSRDPSVEVRGLLTTVNATHERVAMHAVRRELLRAQARAARLPLVEIDIPYPCSNEQYEAAVRAALEPQVAAGVEAVAFGDLFLEDVRAYRVRNNERLGLGSLFPLWGRDTRDLAREMVAIGQRAVLTCVDPRTLPASFAGRAFDASLLADLPAGVDPCGENGEFHTFVHAGPQFREPLDVEVGRVVERDGFVFADALPRAAPTAALVRRLFGEHAPQLAFACEPIGPAADFAHAAEAALVERAVPTRRAEFAAGRRLAHRLLDGLGAPHEPLLVAGDRAPLWPRGFTGTLSHGAGLCAVAVARRDHLRAVGLDVESADPLAADLVATVLTPRERARLDADGGQAEPLRRAKLHFAAKEAVYKAVAAEVGRLLELHEVEIDLDEPRGRFEAHVAPLAGRVVTGAFASDAGAPGSTGARAVYAAVVLAR
jgi:uncharacterized protein (TIGR00290 family)